MSTQKVELRRSGAASYRAAMCLLALQPILVGRGHGQPTQSAEPTLHEIASPAGPGSLGPNLARTSRGVYLSWLEPDAGQDGKATSHALRVARLEPGAQHSQSVWAETTTVTEGGTFFANWADFPALSELPGGTLLAHWLERTGDDSYAYGVRLARSQDRGKSWEALGFLHDDRSATEHGFVAWTPVAGGVQAFWLDGRDMANGGPMALHSVLVKRGARAFETGISGSSPASTVLDGRVCECCQTDAAVARDGPVVVYRDRSADEVRDIWIVRATPKGWSAPRPVFEDGWRIPGCPVNGPAAAASGDRVVVAWFTGAGDRPVVKAAVSNDGGATFAPPLVLDGEAPIGRVDVALQGDTAWVTWLGRTAEGAAVRLRPVWLDRGAAHEPGPVSTLAETAGARSSGFPRLLALDRHHLLVTWVDTSGEQRVRTALVAITP